MSDPAVHPALAALDDVQRAFAEAVAAHGDPLKALSDANIARDPRESRDVLVRRLMDDPKVKAAIAAARHARKQRRAGRMNRDAILEDIEEVYEQALGKGDFTNALKAKAEQAQLLGLRVEKREVTVTNAPEQMSTADLKRLILDMKRMRDANLIDVTPAKVDESPVSP